MAETEEKVEAIMCKSQHVPTAVNGTAGCLPCNPGAVAGAVAGGRECLSEGQKQQKTRNYRVQNTSCPVLYRILSMGLAVPNAVRGTHWHAIQVLTNF